MAFKKHFAGAVMLLCLNGCQTPTAATTGSASNKADARFVTQAYQVIEFDRQEGDLARVQAKDPRVKAIAAKLLEEANRYAEQLSPTAKQLGIKPPTELRDALRVSIVHMRVQNGLMFDRNYLDDQIASHEDALRSSETINSQEYSAPLIDLARRGQALISKNLDELRELRRTLRGAA